MIVVSNTAEQTLAPGQTLIFDEIVTQSGCSRCCGRRNTGAVKLQGNAQYNVFFSANVGGTTAAAPVQLSVVYDGSPLPETTRISTPAAVGDLNAIAAATVIKTCCGCGGSITVVNTGTNPVVVAPNSALMVDRRG